MDDGRGAARETFADNGGHQATREAPRRKRRRPVPVTVPPADAPGEPGHDASPQHSPQLAWTPSGANLTMEFPTPAPAPPSWTIAAPQHLGLVEQPLAPPAEPGWYYPQVPAHAAAQTAAQAAAHAAAQAAAHTISHTVAHVLPAPASSVPAARAPALDTRAPAPAPAPAPVSAPLAHSFAAAPRRRDLLDQLDEHWFRYTAPAVHAAAERADPDSLLSVADASWFMAAMERSNLARLPPTARAQMQASGLRGKAKHRTAVVFSEDLHFVTRRTERFALDMRDPACARDPQKWIVHALCRELAQCFPQSLAMKAGRSCIWSAMLARALFHLERSGFMQARIADNGSQRTREATLFVNNYHISRSNFTKIFKRYLPQLAAEDGGDDDDDDDADQDE